MKADAPPDWLRALAQEFRARGWALYAVGGWVRDRLLGLPSHDVDLCGPAPPGLLIEGLRDHPWIRATPAAPTLGTLILRVDIDGVRRQAEYTAFRSESYRAGGRHRPETVTLGVPLEGDALRRDFTVNALYLDILSGAIIDPLSGIPDISGRTLRTTREPEAVFDDDGLRLMRLARLAGELHFGVDPGTMRAARDRAGRLDDIAPERIADELTRILLADTRYPSSSTGDDPVGRALLTLDAIGALGRVLPEVAACRGLLIGGMDGLSYSVGCASRAPAVLHLRLAALLHDIGRPGMPEAAILEHGAIGAQRVSAALRRLRFSREIVERTALLVRHHTFDPNGRARPDAVRWFFARMGYPFVRDLIALRRAIEPELRAADRWDAILAAMIRDGAPDTPDALALTGRDIAGLLGEPPSARVGRLKRALWRYAVEHPRDNTMEGLTRAARQLLDYPARWDYLGRRED
ncbi:MAG: CCA tRNA nucleotidyltransferase [Clostridiales bacterium]|nr:CCA tRNA nucleotidyltransferase [Clostridiales bacterium]